MSGCLEVRKWLCGNVRETARERGPRWAHQVSRPLDPRPEPSVPWEGTVVILLGAHGFLQVLSLGFGDPWERKGRKTKGFWGWGPMTQSSGGKFGPKFGQDWGVLCGVCMARVLQRSRASEPWGEGSGGDCSCSLAEPGPDLVLRPLTVLLGVPERGQGHARGSESLGASLNAFSPRLMHAHN